MLMGNDRLYSWRVQEGVPRYLLVSLTKRIEACPVMLVASQYLASSMRTGAL